MSYSFSIIAASKAAAKAELAAKFDDMLVHQPVHAADRAPAEAAVVALVDLLAEPGEGERMIVNVSGSLGWGRPDPAPGDFNGAGLNVSARVAPGGLARPRRPPRTRFA